MKVQALVQLPIAKLVVPGRVKRLMATERVQRLAKASLSAGQPAYPVIDDEYRVIYGLDAVAAALLNNDVDIVCVRAEFEDGEARSLVEMDSWSAKAKKAEQVRRDTQSILLELDNRTNELLSEVKGTGKLKAKRARRKARKELKEKYDLPDHWLPQKEGQRRKRAEDGLEFRFDFSSAKPTKEFLSQLGETRFLIEQTFRHLTRAKGDLSTLEGKGLPRLSSRISEFHGEIADIAARVRAMIPMAVCPYCKLVPELMGECLACCGSGYITRTQLSAVPLELRRSPPMVRYRGRTQPLSDFADPFGLGDTVISEVE